MKVLLTGANGFVGSHIASRMNCIEMREEDADIRDFGILSKWLQSIKDKKFDAVIHLAAQSHVPASVKNPRETYDINFIGTFNLLKALESIGFAGRLLFVGSGDCYGIVPEADLPVRETQPLRPVNPYAVSKVAVEALAYQWSHTTDFEIITTRSFNHMGPRQSPMFVISNIAKQFAEIAKGLREPIIELGSLDVSRDFTDIEDIVAAYAALLERGTPGEVYNVCSGREYFIRDILKLFGSVCDIEYRLVQNPDSMRHSEQKRMVGSRQKIKEHTGWEPSISIEDSIKKIFHYWLEK